jgi:NAD dependent epimerase/dehydratase family enzyme
MHLILTGATGFVGSAALDMMLNNPAVTRISILSRRPVKQAEGHEKAVVILKEDMSEYSQEILDRLRGAHGCVWTMGPPLMSVQNRAYVEALRSRTLNPVSCFRSVTDHGLIRGSHEID